MCITHNTHTLTWAVWRVANDSASMMMIDQISHRSVTHMTPIMTGHDNTVTGLMEVDDQ